jgi:hypothetical protein
MAVSVWLTTMSWGRVRGQSASISDATTTRTSDASSAGRKLRSAGPHDRAESQRSAERHPAEEHVHLVVGNAQHVHERDRAGRLLRKRDAK